tara:strand:+ start:826 stop:1725 length:900 start_codon:yes stop_codon:yes gene_type:complete
MRIAGAGLAGLIAAHIFRRHEPVVFEAQKELPSNHSAILRFRTPVVSEATGIPFKKVDVQKAAMWNGELTTKGTVAISNAYSQKVTGAVVDRSVLNLYPVERYIAPHNLVDLLAKGIDIRFGTKLTLANGLEPIIWTAPMPILMDIMEWEKPEFKFNAIWVVTWEILTPDVDVFQTIYYPADDVPYYRASINGNRLIVEYAQQPDENYLPHDILWDFGIGGVNLSDGRFKKQSYGKILNIDEKLRRKFVMAMTDDNNIYSLGRFATWRQLLLDDIVGDARKIDRWIETRDDYGRTRDGR